MDRYQVLTVSSKNVYPKFMHLTPRTLLVLSVVALQEKLAFEKAYWFILPCFPLSPAYTAVFRVPILWWIFQWKVFESFCFFHSTEEGIFSCCWLTTLSPTEMHFYPRTLQTRTGVMWSELHWRKVTFRVKNGALWGVLRHCMSITSRPLPTSSLKMLFFLDHWIYISRIDLHNLTVN